MLTDAPKSKAHFRGITYDARVSGALRLPYVSMVPCSSSRDICYTVRTCLFALALARRHDEVD